MDIEEDTATTPQRTRSLRALDIIVLGATGYTGKLVAQYLAQRSPSIRLGLAGRSLEKLYTVRATLPAEFSEIPLLICTGHDKQSLARVAVQTSVLVNCVGPFGINGGENVVEVCINNLTHYVDSTGEPSFYKNVTERFHDRAAAAGVCIVPACGLDSLPWDASTHNVVFSSPDGGYNTGINKVEVFAELHVIPTAGTIESALTAISQMKPSDSKNLVKAWFNTGAASQIASKPRTKFYPHYNTLVKAWVVPIPSLDSTVMRRTLLQLQQRSPVPVDVHLGQYLVLRAAYAPVYILLFVLVVLPLLLLIGKLTPLRNLAVYLLRRFGRDGPSPEERAQTYVRMTAIGSNSNNGPRKITNITAVDPGYGTTAKWIGECALLLLDVPVPASASNSDQTMLLLDKVGGGGVLTPASCFGHHLLKVLAEQKTMTVS